MTLNAVQVVGSSDFSNAKLGDVVTTTLNVMSPMLVDIQVLRPVMLVSTKGTLMTDADCDSEEMVWMGVMLCRMRRRRRRRGRGRTRGGEEEE